MQRNLVGESKVLFDGWYQGDDIMLCAYLCQEGSRHNASARTSFPFAQPSFG